MKFFSPFFTFSNICQQLLGNIVKPKETEPSRPNQYTWSSPVKKGLPHSSDSANFHCISDACNKDPATATDVNACFNYFVVHGPLTGDTAVDCGKEHPDGVLMTWKPTKEGYQLFHNVAKQLLTNITDTGKEQGKKRRKNFI